jgi:WD40 repeat protein
LTVVVLVLGLLTFAGYGLWYYSHVEKTKLSVTAKEAVEHSDRAEKEKLLERASELFALGTKFQNANDPLAARLLFAHSLRLADSIETRKKLGACSTTLVSLRWCVHHPSADGGSGNEVTAVAFTPDGTQIITGSLDSTVRGWDSRTSTLQWTLKTPAPVTTLALSFDGNMLATGGPDNQVRLWEQAGRTQLAVVPLKDRITTLAFRHDDREVSVTTSGDLGRSAIVLIDPQIGKIKKKLGHWAELKGVAYHPTYGWAVGGGGGVRGGGGTLWQWPSANSAMERKYDLPHFISCVAWPMNGRFLAFGAADGSVWGISEKGDAEALDGRHEGTVESIALSPSGELLVSGGADGTLRLFDARSRRQLAVLRGHTNRVRQVAISPDGSMVASCGADGTVRVWGIGGLNPVVLRGNKHFVSSVRFLKNDQLVTTSWDNSIRMWDRLSGETTRLLRADAHVITRSQLGISQKRSLLAVAEGLRKGIRVYTLPGLELSQTLGDTPFTAGSVAISPDGSLIALGSGKGELYVWQVSTGELLAQTQQDDKNLLVMCFSPDSSQLAIGSDDGVVRLVDPGTSKVVDRIEFGQVRCEHLAFDPSANGRKIAVALADGTVRVWDVQEKREVLKIDYATFALAYHPGGRWLALVRNEKNVRVEDVVIWDLSSNSEVARLSGHEDRLQDVAFSPNGQYVASASADATARVWHVDGLLQALTLNAESLVDLAENTTGLRLCESGVCPLAEEWKSAAPMTTSGDSLQNDVDLLLARSLTLLKDDSALARAGVRDALQKCAVRLSRTEAVDVRAEATRARMASYWLALAARESEAGEAMANQLLAASAVKSAVDLQPNNPKYRYLLARCYALAAGSSSGAINDEDAKIRYVGLALSELETLQRSGAIDKKQLSTDSAFESLRGDRRFQKIVSGR